MKTDLRLPGNSLRCVQGQREPEPVETRGPDQRPVGGRFLRPTALPRCGNQGIGSCRKANSPRLSSKVFMAAPSPVSPASASAAPVDLKTPWLAALLSWAVPGAGQIYQGRYFKGIVFAVCILGMFFFGVNMGEGRPVYSSYYTVSEGQVFKKRNYGYLSQILVGTAAMPAMLQARRFDSYRNTVLPESPIEEVFHGRISNGRQAENAVQVTGAISLSTVPGPLGMQVEGRLIGTVNGTGEPIDVELVPHHPHTGIQPLGLNISADPERFVQMRVQTVNAGPPQLGENLSGSIPRSFFNWYQVPLQDDQMQDLNARLGKHWEVAMVMTWLAGLLNIFVIWDALEGPAYGRRPINPDAAPGKA